MTFTSSPSLKEYKDGIPPKKPERLMLKLVVRGLIAVLIVLVIGLGLYDFSKSSSVQLLVGKGEIAGRVVDELGAPLDGEVFVAGVDLEVKIAPDGSFKLSGIPSGPRSLVVAQYGTAQEYNVEVLAGAIQNVGELKFVRVTPEPTN